MSYIDPIDSDLQSQVTNATKQYIQLASEIFTSHFPIIPVSFSLIGRAAGMYHLRAGRRYIRYNPYIFAKYFDDNLKNTVPHEVAHYVADLLYGIKNIRPHGREWQNIMAQFGVEASKHCNYDLQGIPQRRQRRFTYQCQCRIYDISTRRHNMITNGQRRYQCPACKALISYSGDPQAKRG